MKKMLPGYWDFIYKHYKNASGIFIVFLYKIPQNNTSYYFQVLYCPPQNNTLEENKPKEELEQTPVVAKKMDPKTQEAYNMFLPEKELTVRTTVRTVRTV